MLTARLRKKLKTLNVRRCASLTAPSANDPQKADHALKEAIARYRQIVDQYPRTPTAPLALYHLGNTLVQANELSAAIEAYQRFLMLYSSNPSMAGLVQQRLAYVYLLKGDRDQAVKALTAILETPGTLNRDQALFELARLEESQSRPEGALAHYQELIKTYPNSPFTSEATIRTKIMDVKKSQESTPASDVDDPGRCCATEESSVSPFLSGQEKILDTQVCRCSLIRLGPFCVSAERGAESNG